MADAELAFVLRVALRAACVPEDDGNAVVSSSSLSWPRVLECAAQTRLLPVLGWGVDTALFDCPGWLKEAATDPYRQSQARNRAWTAEAERISAFLDAAGIPIVWRKGVHVAGFYADRGCRPFSDIDMFVGRETFGEVLSALEPLGFREEPMTRTERAYLLLATNTGPTLVKLGSSDSTRLSVDPTFTLLPPALAAGDGADDDLSFGALLARSQRGPCGFRVLAPADLLLDLAVNTYVGAKTLHYLHRFRFQRAIPHVDLVAVTKTLSAEDWVAFRSRVTTHGLNKVARFAFASAQEVFRGLAVTVGPTDLTSTAPRALVDGYGELDGSLGRWRTPWPERMMVDELSDDVPQSGSPLGGGA